MFWNLFFTGVTVTTMVFSWTRERRGITRRKGYRTEDREMHALQLEKMREKYAAQLEKLRTREKRREMYSPEWEKLREKCYADLEKLSCNRRHEEIMKPMRELETPSDGVAA